jgi:hypothetical protein
MERKERVRKGELVMVMVMSNENEVVDRRCGT